MHQRQAPGSRDTVGRGDIASLPPGIYSKELTPSVDIDICTGMPTAALFIMHQNVKPFKCPTIGSGGINYGILWALKLI